MTIEERLDALEKEVQRLNDIQEILNLKGKYFRCMDGKLWDEMETTLSPNIVTSYSNGKLVFHGPKETVGYISSHQPKEEITMHMGHTPEITILSETEAIGRWYLQDNLIFGPQHPYEGTGIQGGAFYTDKYEKVDGKWLILETGYERIYEEMFQRDASHKFTSHMFIELPKPAKKKKK